MKKQQMCTRPNHGFTLVELLVVVVVLGILVAFAAREFSDTISDTKLATLKKNLSTIRDQLNAYSSDKGFFPQTLSDLTVGKKPYISEIPVDPLTNNRDWQVAPPAINSIDLNFFAEAAIDPAKRPVITYTPGPSFDPPGQNSDRIIDSSIADPLTFGVLETVDPGVDAFSPNLPTVDIDLRAPRNVQSVRIIFYSVPKIRYRIEELKIGTETFSGWANNDVFTATIKKPVNASKITLKFDVRKTRAIAAKVLVGIESIEMVEKTGDLEATSTSTLVEGNKWYRTTEWESVGPEPGHARSFGIGQVRSNKQGYSVY